MAAAESPSFQLTEADDRSAVRLMVAGELDVALAEPFQQQVEAALGDGRPLMINLSAVTFIDSSGLRAVVDCLLRAREARQDVTIDVEVGIQVRRILDLTGIDHTFWPQQLRS